MGAYAKGHAVRSSTKAPSPIPRRRRERLTSRAAWYGDPPAS
jgi:hypothetical protein